MEKLEEAAQSNALISKKGMLDGWTEHAWTNGIQLNQLRELDTLNVETTHHTYEITIINPNTAEVFVRGGELFPERTVARLAGASMGGSFLKLHGI
jgi:hypothetical protein